MLMELTSPGMLIPQCDNVQLHIKTTKNKEKQLKQMTRSLKNSYDFFSVKSPQFKWK